MKFSERWLREWTDPAIDTTGLVEQLTMAGLEVESVTDCKTGFSGVVTAQVKQVKKHPSADNLSVCVVDAGNGDAHTVVCGAPNVRTGGFYPYARIGASLPGIPAIGEATIKGVKSDGMLCSAAELGLSEVGTGLLELESGTATGMALDTYLQLDDQILELSLTPNRGDCLSIRGVAREVAVINHMEYKPLYIAPVPAESEQCMVIRLKAPKGCPRYAGRIISGIDINRPAPLWLTEKLRRSGIRSINPIVDVTNFVMVELGQPLHAFDFDLLQGGINVRFAKQGEVLTILDGARVELTPDTLVIADDARPVAMAGIMGGLDTGITGSTRNIFLESAYFSPTVIMGRARHYGLHTDSAHRFERGVDYELQVLAIERATRLILDLCGGSAGPVVDISTASGLPKPPILKLRNASIMRLLGTQIDQTQVGSILQRLGMHTTAKAGGWSVKIPSFRFDISLEADLVEEIARIYGYEHIPCAPLDSKLIISRVNSTIDIKEIQQVLVSRGYQEVVTYSFVDVELQNNLLQDVDTQIRLLNPISTAMSVMRMSLWPGLISTLLYNLKRQQQHVRIFENGRVFSQSSNEIIQDIKLGGLSYGNISLIQWDNNNILSNFYYMKGDVEALILHTDRNKLTYRSLNHPTLHPGQSAEIFNNNQLIGICGALHPRLLQSLEIPGPVMLFELNYSAISARPVLKYKKVSKFPAIKRDISILVNNDEPVKNILNAIKSASPALLTNLELFDVYHGEGIDILKKSLALSLTFQASSYTLTDDEAGEEVENILAALKSKFDGKLRE